MTEPLLIPQPTFRQDALLAVFHISSEQQHFAKPTVRFTCSVHGGRSADGHVGFRERGEKADPRCTVPISEQKLCWEKLERIEAAGVQLPSTRNFKCPYILYTDSLDWCEDCYDYH